MLQWIERSKVNFCLRWWVMHSPLAERGSCGDVVVRAKVSVGNRTRD